MFVIARVTITIKYIVSKKSFKILRLF